MNTRRGVHRPGRSLKGMLAFTAVVLLLLVGLFLASVVLTPLSAPVHALYPPSVAASQAPSDQGVNGTLASFTALFPELQSVYIPLLVH